MSLSDKKARARLLAARRREEYARSDATSASHLLSKLLAEHPSASLAGYLPIKTEIDPRPSMSAHHKGPPVGVPVVVENHHPLIFALWEPDCPMVKGAFGTMVPDQITEFVPQIIIVPLLAFTAHGHRLGYGGGFYDRTLSNLRKANCDTLAIGFAWDCQEMHDLPIEETDETMDMIVTDKRMIDCRRA